MEQSRGIRNNNPGNIRLSQQHWFGQAVDTANSDKDFVTFVYMQYGVRAAAIIFINYQTRYGLKSPAQLIGRWAPENENDTGSYISDVCKNTGFRANMAINLTRSPILSLFTYAVFMHENGWDADIDETQFRNGIALALKARGLA